MSLSMLIFRCVAPNRDRFLSASRRTFASSPLQDKSIRPDAHRCLTAHSSESRTHRSAHRPVHPKDRGPAVRVTAARNPRVPMVSALMAKQFIKAHPVRRMTVRRVSASNPSLAVTVGRDSRHPSPRDTRNRLRVRGFLLASRIFGISQCALACLSLKAEPSTA